LGWYSDFFNNRDKVEFIQAVRTLADVVNLELPKGNLSPENYQNIKRPYYSFRKL
jgi:hypothetical protein